MNERIKELAMELAEQYDWDPPHDPTYYTFSSDDLKKFAELIVDQMLAITDAHTEVFQTDRDRALIEHIKQSVKTHFGA